MHGPPADYMGHVSREAQSCVNAAGLRAVGCGDMPMRGCSWLTVAEILLSQHKNKPRSSVKSFYLTLEPRARISGSFGMYSIDQHGLLPLGSY